MMWAQAVVLAAVAATAAADCIYSPVDGTIFNFTELSTRSAKVPFMYNLNGYTYEWAWCQSIMQAGNPMLCPPTNSSTSVAKAVAGNCQAALGLSTNVATVLFSQSGVDGIQVTYTGSTPCSGMGSPPPSTVFQVLCDAKLAPGIQSINSLQDNGCSVTISLNSAAGCPIVLYTPVTPTPSGSIGAGWIVLLVFLSLGVVYLVGGMIYKRRKYGASGLEAIPNIDMWRSLGSKTYDVITCGKCPRKTASGGYYGVTSGDYTNL